MPQTEFFDSGEKYVQWKLNTALLNKIEKIEKNYDSIAVVCIGTDRSTGDSYGPLTGQMLSKLRTLDFALFGTLDMPVHALALSKALESIDESFLVIAVDAGMGAKEMVGNIELSYDPIKPGSGVGKDLPIVGDISITGIVALGGIAPFVMLQNAPLGLVYNMAEKTFFAIQYALRLVKIKKQESINLGLSSYKERNG